ncbi:MAG: hypothetical protein MZV63_05595 [Marinilabiliales bacterium]|nr:hypothetical protein [Marinilabiliales bacterium]
MTPAAVERVREWNRAGGTIIAYKDGNRWVSANKFAEIDFIENAPIPEGSDKRIY